MKIIINSERGRECKNLEKFWIITKEKLERSDHDFELSFNRLHFLARSKVGLASADVIDNVLFYLSVMYKACYHSLCVLQAYEIFVKKVIMTDVERISEVTMGRWYYQSFQEGDVMRPVSNELAARFSEMILANERQSVLLKHFFDENNIVLLKLIACLNHFSIGYQAEDETKRRAYLFAKLLRVVRDSLQNQLSQCSVKNTSDTVVNLEQININSIIPNLKLKIDLFDFGICFKSGKVISCEFNSRTEDRYTKIHYDTLPARPATAPSELCVTHDNHDAKVSVRAFFDLGIVHIPKEYSVLPIVRDSQLYLASSHGSIVWRLVKKYILRF